MKWTIDFTDIRESEEKGVEFSIVVAQDKGRCVHTVKIKDCFLSDNEETLKSMSKFTDKKTIDASVNGGDYIQREVSLGNGARFVFWICPFYEHTYIKIIMLDEEIVLETSVEHEFWTFLVTFYEKVGMLYFSVSRAFRELISK